MKNNLFQLYMKTTLNCLLYTFTSYLYFDKIYSKFVHYEYNAILFFNSLDHECQQPTNYVKT